MKITSTADISAKINIIANPANAIATTILIVIPIKNNGKAINSKAKKRIIPKLNVAARLSPHFSLIIRADFLKAFNGFVFS